MKWKYLLWILLLAACNQQEKKDKNPIVGTWVYEKIERVNGEPIDTNDSAFNVLHQQHRGLSFSFTEDYDFKVTQRKPDNTEEFIAEQPYELPDDRKILILKNTGRPDDEFPIINLSDSFLRINVFKSPVAYIVFKKMNSE